MTPHSFKVLVPVDFSRFNRETIDFALNLGGGIAAQYCLLHVLNTQRYEPLVELDVNRDEVLAQQYRDVEQRLATEVAKCKQERPHLQLEYRVAQGIPFKEICAVADRENFQLIVIGTHGCTGLSHLLIGSTAERVVQHASCPVLSMKPRVL